MIFRDQFSFAFGNLHKTRLRTILTAAGVMIGIGAMTSMVSVGVGTQRKVMQAFGVPLLGQTFDPMDFVMFGVGVLLAALVDRQLLDRFLPGWSPVTEEPSDASR